MKRAVLVLITLLLILAAVVTVRALPLPSKPLASGGTAPPLMSDRAAALARFTRAIQFRTISFGDETPSGPVEHQAFVAWLAEAYPRVHASLAREVIGGSLLYVWKGTDPSLAPLLLMGHFDVVPIEPGTEAKWERPPFSGAVAGGFVWGRGTLDDKLTVISLLESAELLLDVGYAPRRTIYFAFGHDEEAGGRGAERMAKTLASRGVKFDAVIDEGGVITVDSVAGAPRPVALIAIAEKGAASVELTARGQGGHSSMPPPRTEVGAIAAAVAAVQRKPFDADVRGAAALMFRWLAPEMPFARKVVMANVWLFEPLLKLQAAKSNSMNAAFRTTIAPTVIDGGVKDNVIPSHARAVINFRILPGDTAAGVLAHVRNAVDDAHVSLRFLNAPWEPSPVSDPDAPQFRALQQTIGQIFPDVIVTPYLAAGATDARYYRGLSPNVYRFMPVMIRDADLTRIHGSGERVTVDGYFEAIRFYRTLIVNMSR